MNIQLPYSWIKEFVRTKLTPEEFAAKLSLSGPSVDRWWKMGEGLARVVVGELLDFKKHPNADNLHIAKVDVGIGKPIQLIFGQMVMMKVGNKVPVAVAPCTLPNGLKIEKAKMRGEISEGMLCLDQELGLLEEGVSIRFFDSSVKNGTPLSEALELNDTIFDIEVTSNRPDAFCAVGIAREAAAVLDAPFLWKPAKNPEIQEEQVPLEIQIEAPKACLRYQGAVVKDVRARPSPWWMQKRLIAAGIRPISNLVDITNYVMLETGKPLHVFDADKLEKKAGKYFITARMAKEGEKLLALDEKEYELNSSILVIADAKKPIAIGGIMGGEDTGVTHDTTNVIFESAVFDPVLIRRTARALNCYSDSSLRFEKGLSTESTTAAIARAVGLVQEIANGTPASPLYDRRAKPYQHVSFPWNPQATTKALGVTIPTANMKKMLTTLGFDVRAAGKNFKVTVPYWRDHDIEASQDLDEEVGRIYGYHHIPSVLPDGKLSDQGEDPALVWEERLRECFRGAGSTETYSNSFVSRALLEKSGFDMPVFALQNPLTEDLAVMRPSLIPSLLQIVAENETEHTTGSLFEVANKYIFQKGELPDEILQLCAAWWGESPNGELFFRAKGMFESIMSRWNIDVQLVDTELAQQPTFVHSSRRMSIQAGGKEIGFVGEAHPTITEQMGVRHPVAILCFDVMNCFKHARAMRYEPLLQFPPVRRDISFIAPERTTYAEVVKVLQSESLLRAYELFDVYQGKGIPEGKKSMAFHLTFADSERTLTGEEADRAFGHLAGSLKRNCAAEVRDQ